jgi:hypothetical protein
MIRVYSSSTVFVSGLATTAVRGMTLTEYYIRFRYIALHNAGNENSTEIHRRISHIRCLDHFISVIESRYRLRSPS